MARKKKDDQGDKKEAALPADLFLGVNPADLPPSKPRCTAVIPANATVAEWTAGVVHVGEAEVDLSAKLQYDIYMRAKEFAKHLKHQRTVTDIFATEQFSQVFLSEIGGSDYVCCTAKVSKGTMMTNAILDIITAKDKVPFGNAIIVQVEKVNRYVRYKAVSAKKAAEVINGFLASKMRAVALKDPLIRKRYWNIDPGCVEGQNIFGASERDVEDQYEWGPNTMLMGLHYKTHRCQRVFKHDWFKCPFYHTLLDGRRSPLHFTYSNQRCSDAPSDDKGKCSKGAMCPMAHNDCEHFYHPDFVRKSVCMYADNPSQCKGPLCSFMHPAEMMRRDFTEYQNMKGNKEASRQESLPPARAPAPAPVPAPAPAPPREFDAVPTWGEGKDEWPTALNSSRGASSQKATSQPSQGDAFQTFQSEASQVSLGSQLSEHSQPNSFDPVHDSSGSAPHAGVIGGGSFGAPGGFGVMGGPPPMAAAGHPPSAMGTGSYFGVFDSIGSGLTSEFEFSGEAAIGHSGLFGLGQAPSDIAGHDDWAAEGIAGAGLPADDYPDTTSNIFPPDASIGPQVLGLSPELAAYLSSKCTMAGTCHVCKAPATWKCSDGKCSGSLLCDRHNTMTHKRKQWRNHKPIPVVCSPMTCEDCEDELDELCFLCHDCEQVQCFECRQLDPMHRPGAPGHEVNTYRLVDIQKTVNQLNDTAAASQPSQAAPATVASVPAQPRSQAVAPPKLSKKEKKAASTPAPAAPVESAPTSAPSADVERPHDGPAVAPPISMDVISSAIVKAASAPEDSRVNLVQARAATLDVLAKLLISMLSRGGPQWQMSVVAHCKSHSVASASSFNPSHTSQWTWDICSSVVERFSPIPQAGPLFRPPMVETNLLVELLSPEGKKHSKWNAHKGDVCAAYLCDLLRVLKLEASVLRLFDVAVTACQVEDRFPQVFTRPDAEAWPPILAYVERPLGSQEGRKDILVVGGHPGRANVLDLLKKKWNLVLDFEMDGGLLRKAEDHCPKLRKVDIASICQNVAGFRLNPEETTWIRMHSEQEFQLDRFNFSRFAIGGAKDEALQHVFRELAPVPFPWLEALCVVLFYGDPLKIKTLGKHVDHCMNLILRAPTLNSRFITLTNDVASARSLVTEPVLSASMQYARDNAALFGGLQDSTGVAPAPVARLPCDGGETVNVDVSQFGCAGLLELLSLGIDSVVPTAKMAELIQAFIHGLPVDWRLLSSAGAPIVRDIFPSLLKDVEVLLREAAEACCQRVLTLVHEPGSGGTTLARQVAWELHTSYPVIALARSSSMGMATQLCLRLYDIYRKCGLPLLLLVDGVDPGFARVLLQEAADVPLVVLLVHRVREWEQPRLRVVLSEKEKGALATFRKATAGAEEVVKTQHPTQFLLPPTTNFLRLDAFMQRPQELEGLVDPLLNAGPMEGSPHRDLVIFVSLLFLHKGTALSFADASVFALHFIVAEHKASVVDWLLASPCCALLIIDLKKSTLQPLNRSVALAVVEVARERGVSPLDVLSRALGAFEPVFGQVGSKLRQALAEMIYWRASSEPQRVPGPNQNLALLRRAHERFSSTMSAVFYARELAKRGEDDCKRALAVLSNLDKSPDAAEHASQCFALAEVGLTYLRTQTDIRLVTKERVATMVTLVAHLCTDLAIARTALMAAGDPPRLQFAATLKLELLCIMELLQFFLGQQEGAYPAPLLACLSLDQPLLKHGPSRCLQLYAQYQALLAGAGEWPAATTAYASMWELRGQKSLSHPVESFVADRSQLELLLALRVPGAAGCELARLCAAGLLHYGLQAKDPQEWAKGRVADVAASMRATVEAAEYRTFDFQLWVELARWQKKSSHADAVPLLPALLQSKAAGQLPNLASTAPYFALAYRLLALIEAETSGATAKRLKKLSNSVTAAQTALQRTVMDERYPRAFYENPRQVLVSLDVNASISSHFFLPDALFPYFEKKGKPLTGKLSKEAAGWRVLYHDVPLCIDSKDEHVEATSFHGAEVTFHIAVTGRSLHAFDVDLCDSGLHSTQAKHRKGCLDGRPRARTCRCAF